MRIETDKRRCSGFTLLEMITVIAIMAIIMTASLVSLSGIRSGAEMRSATSSLRTVLGLARQHAVTKREKTYVTFFPAAGSYIVTNQVGLIGETNFLPPGVALTSITPTPNIVFLPGGGSGAGGFYTITLTSKQGTQTNTINLYGLTGLTKVN